MVAPKTPALTTDVVIELLDRPGRPIVLIRRRYAPLGWALPGGFVEYHEPVETAARREAAEETGLDVTLSVLLGCYSDPARDPRSHTASVVYVGTASGIPKGGDDAVLAEAFMIGAWPPLAFDHARILADYCRWRETGQLPSPRTSF